MSFNLSALVNWTNETININYNDICPFEPIASLDYNSYVIINFLAFMWLFLDMRYQIHNRIGEHIGLSEKRMIQNNKLFIVMMAVYNTIWLLNQFLLIPLFTYLRGIYGL